MTAHYNLENIRMLLTEGFTEGELRSFCYDRPDFRLVYDRLAEGIGKIEIIHRLIEHADRRELFTPLLAWAKEQNLAKYTRYFPYHIIEEETESPQAMRIFICYNRHITRDKKLVVYLDQFLTVQGYDVFTYFKLQSGQTSWFEEIDRQIKASDFFIVLLSEEGAADEMVQAEVRRASEHRKQQRQPYILPIRLAYEGVLPYPIDACLDPLQYIIWRSETDSERVGQDILAAIAGSLPRQQPIRIEAVGEDSIIAEDGTPIPDEDSLYTPLPSFDPRFLEELEAPGGTVKLRDKFYLEREVDAHLKRQVSRKGTLTTIRGSRQQGKSSLLVRGVYRAHQNKAYTISLDLQRLDSEYMETPAQFLEYLVKSIVRRLHLDVIEVETLWHGSSLGPQEKLTCLLEEYILPKSDRPIVLSIDETDRLLQTTFCDDFFSMVRSWHNSAALGEPWEKLNLVLVISTEPYLLIPDINLSPFNVGLKLDLEDFNESQMHDLNWRHSSPIQEDDFPAVMKLLNGHPYLSRKALYTLVTEKLSWAELTHVAAAEEGPFGDHLRHQQWLLRDEAELRAALKEVIDHNQCQDEDTLFRLLRAGLVRREGDSCICRCDLYRIYFEDKL